MVGRGYPDVHVPFDVGEVKDTFQDEAGEENGNEGDAEKDCMKPNGDGGW